MEMSFYQPAGRMEWTPPTGTYLIKAADRQQLRDGIIKERKFTQEEMG